MKSFSWNEDKFIEVDDPVYSDDESDSDEAINKAGYQPELSSRLEDGVGAEVRLYQTEIANKPRFFIDLIGQSNTIATFVAKDFPHLLETLKQIHPILTLVGLDQLAAARMWDQIARDIRFKH